MEDERSLIAQDLGRRVKAVRTRVGLSLRDVAKKAQVSASLLGQVERGEASPSLLSLVAIADALGTTAGALLDGGTGASTMPHLVTKRDERRVVAAEFCRREYLMDPHDPLAEVAEFEVPPGGYSRTELAAHSGRDYGIITKGTLTVELEDDAHELREGDYIAFDGATPHRVVNNGDSVARAYWLVVHKERQDQEDGD